MAISRVDFGGNTLIDLTEDTVTSAALLSGYTAHAANGNRVVGTLNPSSGVESFNGRTGSVTPMSGDYTDNQVLLSSTMHIGGETQTNVAQALAALAGNSGGQVMVNDLIHNRSNPLTTITISNVDLEDLVSPLAEGQIYIYVVL